ncbi:MAG: hypothetical protein GY730_06835 [bacterium]|nr:hypothetical protein [bacterium]
MCELLSFTEIENSIAKQKIELRKQALLLRYNNVMFEVDNIFRRYENPFFIEDYIKNNNANKKALNDK